MIWELLVILLLLGCSAFFAAAETALTAASRPRMHGLESQGEKAREYDKDRPLPADGVTAVPLTHCYTSGPNQ